MATSTPGTLGTALGSAGGNAFGLELEPGLRGAPANGGFITDFPLPLLGFWRMVSSSQPAPLTQTAGATPYIRYANTSVPTITWRYDSTLTDIILGSIPIPGQYDPRVDDLRVLLCLRKASAATNVDGNTTLAMNVQPRIWSPGQANPALGATTAAAAPATGLDGVAKSLLGDNSLTAPTAVARVLATVPATAGLRDFCWYEFNLGNMAALPGDNLILEVAPSAVVDAGNDNYVEMCNAMIRWTRGISLNNPQPRQQASCIF